MKKGTAIEKIQTLLNGGRPNEDVELKYPTQLIEEMVNQAILEIITAKDNMNGGMGAPGSIAGRIAVPYIVNVGADWKKVMLDKRPLNRTDSILSIKGVDTGTDYGIRCDVAKITIMGTLRPHAPAGAYALLEGDSAFLVFDKTLVDKQIQVFMIPSILDLDDDDDFLLDGNESMLDDLIIPRIQFATMPMDTVLNQSPDTDGPKIQG